jgi:hypothetical protein
MVFDPRGPEGRRPFPAPELHQVEVAAADGREQERRIQPRAMPSSASSTRCRSGTRRTERHGLRAFAQLPVRVDPSDRDDLLGSVNVSPFEGDPFLRTEACPDGEDRDDLKARVKLGGDGFDFVPGAERPDPVARLGRGGTRVLTRLAGFSGSVPSATACPRTCWNDRKTSALGQTTPDSTAAPRRHPRW